MRAQSRRRLLGLGLVTLALATTAVVASAWTIRTGGPLATDSSASVEFGLDDQQVATWGMPLPPNPTVADIKIEAIDLVDMAGLEIVGVSVYYPADGGLVNAYGYPPAGIVTHPVEGSVIHAAGSDSPVLQVLVGFRLAPEAATGEIGGLRVRYSLADGRYETVLPWSLKINRNTP